MKKVLLSILVLALLVPLFGCSPGGTEEPVQFYYLRNSDAFLYGSADGVVTFEERESSGHVGDVKYLLTLYLQGPLDETLESPFPDGCRLVELSRSGSEMTVTLNSYFVTLKGMDLTLACVCLARTCLSLVNVQTVHIQAESFDGQLVVHETINIDSLLLEDSTVPTETGE